MSRVQTGLETLINDFPEKIRGARIGVVCHPASVDAELRHADPVEALARGGEPQVAVGVVEQGVGKVTAAQQGHRGVAGMCVPEAGVPESVAEENGSRTHQGPLDGPSWF